MYIFHIKFMVDDLQRSCWIQQFSKLYYNFPEDFILLYFLLNLFVWLRLVILLTDATPVPTRLNFRKPIDTG